MKSKILSGAGVWLLLITVAHLHLNVGWARAVDNVKVFLGLERPELVVGFLPVT